MEICDGAIHYCASTGKLTWAFRPERSASWNARFAGRTTGSICRNGRGKPHLTVRLNGRTRLAHRLIMKSVAGLLDHEDVDHINGDATDNRLCNLRIVDRRANNMNIRQQKRNKTGVTGVSLYAGKKKYQALIIIDRNRVFLGSFDTIFEAAAARKSAEIAFGFGPSHGVAM